MGDYLETLLYKVFVSLDDNTSVEEVTSAACESVIDVEQSIILKIWFSHYSILYFAAREFAPDRHRDGPASSVDVLSSGLCPQEGPRLQHSVEASFVARVLPNSHEKVWHSRNSLY
jgi:hypothetical protein